MLFQVRKGFAFYIGEGNAKKILTGGQRFEATPEQIKTQDWKVEKVNAKPAGVPVATAPGKPVTTAPSIPPRAKMVSTAPKKK